MRFQVELEVYQGPLDLLLYLVRKHEVEITDIPIARITGQFLQYVSVLEEIDVEVAGDFVDMASTLIEIKSQLLLPHEEEIAEEVEDPRRDLVKRLLEFKQYRDAASMLEERSREWQERYPRSASEASEERASPLNQPIQGVELWDLVSALGRVMRERTELAVPSMTIPFDETPVQIFMERVYALVGSERRLEFTRLFPEAIHRSTLVGLFLAVLELVRHGQVVAAQADPFGEIWLELGPQPLSVLH
ncbi:MAG: segregation/condensation protein A [Pirellulales bacterium]